MNSTNITNANATAAAINKTSFYTTYKDRTFIPEIFACSLAFLCIAVIGIILNSIIIYVTIKNRHSPIFRTPTNWLIAFTSLCEMCSLSSHFLFFVTSSAGHVFMPAMVVFWLQFLPVLGYMCTTMLLHLTAWDRLFIAIYPVHYQHLSLKKYLSIMLVLTALFSTFCIIDNYLAFLNKPDKKCTGYIGDVVSFPGTGVMAILFMVTHGLTIVLYFITINVVKFRKLKHQMSVQKFYKSVMAIVLFNVGIYIVGLASVSTVFVKLLLHDPVLTWFGNALIGLFFNMGQAANLPILYVLSTDYRATVDREFPFIANLPLLKTCLNNGQTSVDNIMTSVENVSMRRLEKPATAAGAD